LVCGIIIPLEKRIAKNNSYKLIGSGGMEWLFLIFSLVTTYVN
jgi:hypothetical protein